MTNPLERKGGWWLPLLGSLGANAILWCCLGMSWSRPEAFGPPRELVFERIPVPKPPTKVKPIIKPVVVKEEPKPIERSPQKPPPPIAKPEGAHNRIITDNKPSKPDPSNSFVVRGGGNAPLGSPIESQKEGSAVANPPTPPPVTAETPPVKATTTPVVAPPVVIPKHEDVPVVTTPPPAPPVKPKGETREAKPDHQEVVEIPENLKSQSFKSFVRVKVTIESDGKFTVTLRTSSGNPEVDKLVLDTLNKWTWKPALKDGERVESVQQFRFNFTIE